MLTMYGLLQPFQPLGKKLNGITMNTIADQPNRTDYQTRAIVTGVRLPSGQRYSGTVTASRKK